jgi:hypothetical protein
MVSWSYRHMAHWLGCGYHRDHASTAAGGTFDTHLAAQQHLGLLLEAGDTHVALAGRVVEGLGHGETGAVVLNSDLDAAVRTR